MTIMTDPERQPALDEARLAVNGFVARFEPGYRKLACYAALPLVLTPELLGYLRSAFLRGRVPWVAEADLLLSDLCRPVGYEQFAMDQAVRAYLLGSDPERLTPEETRATAEALLGYLRHQERFGQPQRHTDLQAQQWSAMVYLEQRPTDGEPAPRERAVAELTHSLADALARGDQAAQARLAAIVASLSDEIQSYPELLERAREVSELLATDIAPVPPTDTFHPQSSTGETATIEYVTLHIGVAPGPVTKSETGSRPAYIVTLETSDGHSASARAGVDVDRLQVEFTGFQSSGMPEAFSATGAPLFDLLFTGTVRLAYQEAWARLQQNQRFQLQLSISPRLSTFSLLPWELLRDPERGWLALEMPIVRIVTSAAPLPGLHPAPPRVLLTAAGSSEDSTAGPLLGRLRDTLLDTAPAAEVRTFPHLSAALLRQELATNPHVWHFVGNAVSHNGVPSLMLKITGVGSETRLASEIAGMLGASAIRLVILTATDPTGIEPMRRCADVFVAAGVPAVLAPQLPMSEESTGRFFVRLYGCLAAGWTLAGAVYQARMVLFLDSEGEPRHDWAASALFTIDPAALVFADVEIIKPETSAAGTSVEEQAEVSHVDAPSEDYAEVPQSAVSPSLPPLSGVRILWVDDQPDNNRNERQLFEQQGASVSISTSTNDALGTLEAQRYDVIISDMARRLERRAGYTLLERLRERGDQTPFIIYSNSSSAAQQRELRARGGLGRANNYAGLLELVLQAVGAKPALSASPVITPVEYDQPGGTMSPRSQTYVEREADRVFHSLLSSKRVSVVSINAPRQTGKSSLLVRGLERTSRQGAASVYIDYQGVDRSDIESLEGACRHMAYTLAERFGIDRAEIEERWHRSEVPSYRLTQIMKHMVLPRVESQLVLALDEADRLVQWSYSDSFFAMLRSWYNSRALDDLWEKLAIVVVLVSEPNLLIRNVDQSPFNIGTRITLADFNTHELAELNQHYGSPLPSHDLSAFEALLGGQPFLSSLALYTLAVTETDWQQIEAIAATDRGPFGDHLRRYWLIVRDEPALRQALKQVLETARCSDEVSFYRLESAGLVRGTPQTAFFHNRLYEQYFRSRL
jgi:CheY-like chemotaxis protein